MHEEACSFTAATFQKFCHSSIKHKIDGCDLLCLKCPMIVYFSAESWIWFLTNSKYFSSTLQRLFLHAESCKKESKNKINLSRCTFTFPKKVLVQKNCLRKAKFTFPFLAQRYLTALDHEYLRQTLLRIDKKNPENKESVVLATWGWSMAYGQGLARFIIPLMSFFVNYFYSAI